MNFIFGMVKTICKGSEKPVVLNNISLHNVLISERLIVKIVWLIVPPEPHTHLVKYVFSCIYLIDDVPAGD